MFIGVGGREGRVGGDNLIIKDLIEEINHHSVSTMEGTKWLGLWVKYVKF